MYTFKNTGQRKIPSGCKLLWVRGDEELKVNDIAVTSDVPCGGFFKLHLSMTAPEHCSHFKAVFQLIDLTGNAFGE